MNENETLDAYLYRRYDRAELEGLAAGTGEGPAAGDPLTLYATDGVPLAATLFLSSGPTKRGPVAIATATGVRQGFYAPFATYLARRGFDVVTFDYRGIGASKTGAEDATMHDWGERDLAGVVEWTANALGSGKTALVGHSVGGQLAGLLPRPEILSRVVTVGAQIGDYRLWPMPNRLAMAALWYGVVPGVTRAVGYLPGALGVGHDLPPGVALEWARWCRTPDGILSEDTEARRAGFARIRAEVLSFSFGDDTYAPRTAVDALHRFYAGARVMRRHVSRREERRIGHFGFFRARFEETYWNEAAAFLVNGLS